MEDRAPLIIDASTLINFLAVDRVGLLLSSPRHRLIVTEHVRREITEDYPEQLARLEIAFKSGGIEETPVTATNELAVFARLAAMKRLGPGECASIAAASERGCALAIDDKRAAKQATALNPCLVIMNTQALMIALIHEQLLDVATADEIKRTLEREHRFRLPIATFQDVV